MAQSTFGSHHDEQHFNNGSAAKWRLMKWSTFTGVYLLNFLTQIPWVWGNLSVYTSSYFQTIGLSSASVQAPWFICVFYTGWSSGVLMSERLVKRFKRRMAVLVGLLLSNGGILASYWSVQYSPHLLNLTLGFVTGIGCGLIYSIEELYIVEWTDKYVGLATSSVQSFLTLSTVFSNVMVTLYINPDNVQPNKFNGHVNYFSQEDVISRVPTFFLVLGSVSVILNGIGFLLLRDRPNYHTAYSESMPLDYTKTNGNDLRGKCTDGEIAPSDRCIQSHSPETSKGTSQEGNNEFSLDNAKSDASDDCCLSPRQALTTSAFWVLVLNNMVSDLSFINISTYYKAFGSLYIKDDHFLTIIGTLICVSVAVVVSACGVIADKVGVKITTIIATGPVTILIAFYYFTPSISRWLFLLFSVLSCGLVFGVYSLIMIGTLRIFGFKHFTTIYGMVVFSSLLITILVPPFTEFVIVHWGWASMYLMVAIVNFFTLLLTVKGLPRI